MHTYAYIIPVKHRLNFTVNRFEIIIPRYRDMQILLRILGRMRADHMVVVIFRALLLHKYLIISLGYCFLKFLAVRVCLVLQTILSIYRSFQTNRIYSNWCSF